MGQYWIPVNLSKREYIHPHQLGCGLKLWEQLANYPGTGSALVILLAAMPEKRGGGDFDLEENWHGPERTFPEHNATPGPMSSTYQEIAHRTIGRWTGDVVVLVGDYAESTDLPGYDLSDVYERCQTWDEGMDKPREFYFTDITPDVAAVIEHELRGKFEGDGWKTFVENK